MANTEFPAMETNRLILRPLGISDIPAIFAYRSDAEVHRYTRSEPPASPDAMAENLAKWLALPAEKQLPVWVMVLRESGLVVGTISFNQLSRDDASGQLGYDLAREHWGKGIAAEAVRAVLGYGFDTLGLNRIAASCWEGNMASRRVMEKTGMRYEGTLRQSAFVKGAYRDMRFYSVLASEWRAGETPGHGQ